MSAALHSTAVMARRKEPVDSLDFFPTPPWATRALMVYALGGSVPYRSVWEPAAGEGHMAEVLREFFPVVVASDVHDYGKGYEVGSFVGQGPDVVPSRNVDWIITNPPFNLAAAFLDRALIEARCGVAMLLRASWLEGGERYRTIFRDRQPSGVYVFCERVPMVAGRWDPEASSATAYAWFTWFKPTGTTTHLHWIPPGQREALERASDRLRFTKPDASLDLLSLQGETT